MIDTERGPIDYDETGSGTPIVLVPGSCSTGAAWRPVIAAWKDEFRSITTSLLGYGGTAERRTPTNSDISQEAEILEAVIERAGSPVHLVGHSFGGLVALAVALRKRVPLLSLSILEAPLPSLLQQMEEHEHYRIIREMSDAYVWEFRGGNRQAIEALIDFFGGDGTFAAWPQRVRDYAVETTAVNILDWQSAHGFRLTPAGLAKLTIPTLIAAGEASHPTMRRANELLGTCIPGASFAKIAGASHFMISTHPEEVARLVADHMNRSGPFRARTRPDRAESPARHAKSVISPALVENFR